MARLTATQILSIVHLVALAASVASAINPDEKKLTLRDYDEDDTSVDQLSAETIHHPHPHGGKDHSRGAKYFMYAHQPAKKQYEFGYKRGNDHHTIERYEKAGPKHDFKTKVRWHDAHGGHGEQYWDYNHVPKHYPHEHKHHDGHAHHSEPVHSFIEAESKTSPMHQTSDEDMYKQSASDVRGTKFMKRSGLEKKRSDIAKKPFSKKRRNKNTNSDIKSAKNEQIPSVFPDALGFDPYVPPAIAGGNRKRQRTTSRQRNRDATDAETLPRSIPTNNNNQYTGRRIKKTKTLERTSPIKDGAVPKLAFDLDTGNVYDESTDSWYRLVPV